MSKTAVLLGVGFAAGVLFERNFPLISRFFGKARSNENEASSTRETANREITCDTATQTSREELHFQPPSLSITELLTKNNESRQRILRLSIENEALKLERDDLAARESTAIGERDEAVRAMNDALRAEERAHKTIDSMRRARDDAIRSKNEAVRVKRKAVRAEKVATATKDVAIAERDVAARGWSKAIKARDKAVRRSDKLIEELTKQTTCTVQKLARERMDAVLARDDAIVKVESLQRELTCDRENIDRRLQESRAALEVRFTEVMRRVVAAIAERNSLRSITMNPPQ